MIRYLRLWRELFVTCILREMLFRANFVAILATSSWWFIMNVVMFQVIFGHVTEIAGWTKYEIFFLVGTSHATFGIFETLFMVNMTRIPELIRTGELDFYLLKPVNTQFLISARYADFEAVPNTVVGFLFVAWCAAKLHAVFSWTALAAFALFVVNGVVLYYTLLFVSVTVSFWFMRFHAMNIWWQLTSLARQPAEVFPPPAPVRAHVLPAHARDRELPREGLPGPPAPRRRDLGPRGHGRPARPEPGLLHLRPAPLPERVVVTRPPRRPA